jgi:alpha-glutamyl/putrescinyl thymine pyrophosphorylase clade 1
MLDNVLSAPNSINSAPLAYVRRKVPTPTAVFGTYWRFATERQNVYFRRIRGEGEPWTTDPVLREYKFTNAYRAADRTSQYLIRNIIYKKKYGLRDTVLRILLFKFFNKVSTWELIEDSLGDVCEDTFHLRKIDVVLEKALESKASIYSAAYIMPSGSIELRQKRKHRMHLQLLAQMLKDNLAERLADAKSMREAFYLLLSYPSIGPFLAYQFVTDLNYSDHFGFSEMEFVEPGPGARDGLRKCFLDLGEYNEADTIRWVTERQGGEFKDRGLAFKDLWGRPLQLIDCQNIFCEVDKYARVLHPEVLGRSGRVRIKQRFSPHKNAPSAWFPPKWELNTADATSTVILLSTRRG